MDELLEQLRIKVRERNAEDVLADLIREFDGNFGSWLVAKQMTADRHQCNCPDCRDEGLDADVLD